MKRSKMINYILDEMTELHGELMGHDFDVKLANLILTRLEKEGMAPPWCSKSFTK